MNQPSTLPTEGASLPEDPGAGYILPRIGVIPSPVFAVLVAVLAAFTVTLALMLLRLSV